MSWCEKEEEEAEKKSPLKKELPLPWAAHFKTSVAWWR